MTEEPYRWLEAISNRREYVREQLKGGSPAFSVSLNEGILLLGVGTGSSKVFEIHDRHAMTGLGHPADLEKIRQASIDACHVEAFTRAPEDVSLRRLVGFGLSTQVKQNFEQLFSPPVLGEFLFAEVGPAPAADVLARLRFDGTFSLQNGGVAVVAANPEAEGQAREWLQRELAGVSDLNVIADRLLQAWWCLLEERPFGDDLPAETERREGWKRALAGKVLEAALLRRTAPGRVLYQSLDLQP